MAAAFEAAGRLGTDLLRVVTWRLDATGEEDAELVLAASRQAAAASRLGAGRPVGGRWRPADGKEPSAALALADALNHQGRYEEALAALGDWRGERRR